MRASLIDENLALSADADAAIAASEGLILTGAAWRESNGTPAVASFNIVHGADADGVGAVVIVPVELAANGSGSITLPEGGVTVPDGVSIEVIAGVVDVILFYVTDAV